METTRMNYAWYSDDNSETEDFFISHDHDHRLDDNAISFTSLLDTSESGNLLDSLRMDDQSPRFGAFPKQPSRSFHVLDQNDNQEPDNFFLPSGILLEETLYDSFSGYGSTSDYSKASDTESETSNSTWHALPSINNFHAWSSTDTHFSALSKYFSSDSESDSLVSEKMDRSSKRIHGQTWGKNIEEGVSPFRIINQTDPFALQKFFSAVETIDQNLLPNVQTQPKFQFSRANYLPAHPRSPRWQYTKDEVKSSFEKDQDIRQRDKATSQKNNSSKYVKPERKPKGTWKIKSPKPNSTAATFPVEISHEQSSKEQQRTLHAEITPKIIETASAAFSEADNTKETANHEQMQDYSAINVNPASSTIEQLRQISDSEAPTTLQIDFASLLQENELPDTVDTPVLQTQTSQIELDAKPEKKQPQKPKSKQYLSANPTKPKSKRNVPKTNVILFQSHEELQTKASPPKEHKPLLVPTHETSTEIIPKNRGFKVPVQTFLVYLFLFTVFYVMIAHTLMMSGFGWPWVVLIYLFLLVINYFVTINFHLL